MYESLVARRYSHPAGLGALWARSSVRFHPDRRAPIGAFRPLAIRSHPASLQWQPAMMASAGGAAGGKNYKLIGEEAWKKGDKVSYELFALTYGCFVAQLLRESNDPQAVNATLDRMGYSIGCRLIDEFLARTGLAPREFRDAMEVVAKVGLRQFLNVSATVVGGEGEGGEVTLSLESDGLGGEMVELPEEAVKGGLRYANVLCGVIRGALEMINMQVECRIHSDPLLSPTETATVLKVKLIKYIDQARPPSND